MRRDETVRSRAQHSGTVVQYVRPTGESKEDYLQAANNLMMAGNKMVVQQDLNVRKLLLNYKR